MHIRQQIRKAVIAALVGIPACEGRVYSSRVRPTKTDQLPMLAVFCASEQAETLMKASEPPRRQRRDIDLVVVAFVKGHEGIDDDFDALAEEVEQKIFANPRFGGLVRETELKSTELLLDGDGPHGQMVMHFSCSVHTQEGKPSTKI